MEIASEYGIDASEGYVATGETVVISDPLPRYVSRTLFDFGIRRVLAANTGQTAKPMSIVIVGPLQKQCRQREAIEALSILQREGTTAKIALWGFAQDLPMPFYAAAPYMTWMLLRMPRCYVRSILGRHNGFG